MDCCWNARRRLRYAKAAFKRKSWEVAVAACCRAATCWLAMRGWKTASATPNFAVTPGMAGAPPPTAFIPNPASSAERLATVIVPSLFCIGPSWCW